MKKRIVFLALPIITGLAASATGFTLIWRLFILSILVPLISYLWTYFNIRGLRGEIRSLPAKAQVGDILVSRLQLSNLNKVPKLLLSVKENADFPGYSNISSVNLPPKKSFSLESRVRCSKRGQYSLGSFDVSSVDPLGLFRQSKSIGTSQKILVYPNIVELPFFDPLTYINQGYG